MKAKPVLIACCILFSCFFSYGCRHTVTYDANGATSGSVPSDASKYRKNATVTVLGNTGNLAKTDYVFAGWNTAADGSGTSYGQGATFTMGKKDITLFARWTQEPTYTVTYDDNASTGGSPPIDSTAYLEGDNVTVLGNTGAMVKTGLLFGGWNTAANGSGTSYNAGDTFTMGASNVTLYARWIDHWTRLFGGGAEKNTFGMDIAVDAQGNSYITGTTDGALFSQPLNGIEDAFIIKYDAAGNRMLTRFLGTAGARISAFAIAVDASGNIYIGGEIDHPIDDQTLTGFRDAYIAKYNDNGTRLWIRFLGYASASTDFHALAVDQNGNCFATGTANTTADEIVTAKYNENGIQQWAHKLTATGGGARGNGIALNAYGSCFVAGYTTGSLDTQTLTGNFDLFILKYDTGGTLQWLRQKGAASTNTFGNGVAIDSDNNSYIAGVTNASLDGQTLAGSSDALIIKYDGSGAWQWTRQLGQSGETSGEDIAVDEDGTSYITGYTEGSLDGQPARGMYDLFMAKFSAAGEFQWVRQMGAAGSEVETDGYGIAVDANALYVAGYTMGSFDGQPFSGSYYDALIMRWAK